MDELLEEYYVRNAPRPWRAADFQAPAQDAVEPGSVFVLMPMDPRKPELEDVSEAIKEVCAEYELRAFRADDLQHQEQITKVILEKIRTSEHLIADLSLGRPNVYYEVGYAHALNKRPILYRAAGTKLHFDLVVHNVPEYENVTDLKRKLRERLQAVLGRGPNSAD